MIKLTEIGHTGRAGNHVLELVEKVQDIDFELAHPLHHQTEENIALVAQCKESIAIKMNALILVSNNEGKHHLNMPYFAFSFLFQSSQAFLIFNKEHICLIQIQ